MKLYFEMVRLRPGIKEIVHKILPIARAHKLTHMEIMRLAIMKLGKEQKASETYIMADFIATKVKKLMEMMPPINESGSIMGMDFGATSIEQSPSEFGELPTNSGPVGPRKEKKKLKKKIKFYRKVK
jgi:hypothetical protein